MDNDKLQVLIDADEAATYRTDIKGWVDRHGRYFGNDEHAARYSGCTHRPCEACGKPSKKMYTRCDECRQGLDLERYEALKYKEWDGTTPLYSQALNKYLFDLDGFKDEMECDGNMLDLATLRFVICESVELGSVDEDYWSDDLPEEGELPDEVIKALEVFNEVLEDAGVVSWKPGKYRTEIMETS